MIQRNSAKVKPGRLRVAFVFCACKNNLFMICSFFELRIKRKDSMTATEKTEFHRKALMSLLSGLFALAELSAGDGVVRVPRAVQLQILRLLRPAESALRRLIFVLSLEMTLPEEKPRRAPTHPIPKGNGKSTKIPPFRLFDPRKSFAELSQGKRRARGAGPTICFFDGRDVRPAPEPEKPAHDPDDAARLLRRMQAMQKALEDMPKQARRLLRAMAKRAKAPPGPKRYGPLRAGFPPGYRAGGKREVDELLYECGFMARQAVSKPPDTS